MNPYKNIILITLISSSFYIHSQEDKWTGTYVIKSPKSEILDTIKLKKITDKKKEEIVDKYETDLKRWAITSKRDNYQDEIETRRFLYNDKNNEYEQFNWTDLHKKGKMKCLDAHHFFICKTTKNSKVTFPDGESFTSKTGLFGIMLHYGLFELEQIK